MIAIGNNEDCPFCKEKDKFTNTKDNDFLTHLMKKHPDEMEKYLFGNENIGV